MSQNNNNEINGMAFAVALVGLVFLVAAAIVFAVASFAALVFTVLSIMAWKNPLKLGEHVITPQEARAFVYRGLVGMIALPVFAAFAEALLGFRLPPEVGPYLFIGGYVLGSLGIEILKAQEQERMGVEVMPPPPAPEPPPSLPQNKKPFEYASWDDEDSRR